MRKAALHNLGCKVNAYETEAMRQILEEGGYEIVPFDEKADVYVINTCSVTNIADRKSRQMLHRARTMNPNAVIVATGCYVQAKKDEHLKDSYTVVIQKDAAGKDTTGIDTAGKDTACADAQQCDTAQKDTKNKNLSRRGTVSGNEYSQEVDADIILGNNRKHELLECLENFFERREANEKGKNGTYASEENAKIIADQSVKEMESETDEYIFVSDINDRGVEYEELHVAQPAEYTRAFVKIQDGCNQFCSYCIIPYVRGRVRSRSMESVLEEVKNLARQGYQEIVLTGIHLSSYGLSMQSKSQDYFDGFTDAVGTKEEEAGNDKSEKPAVDVDDIIMSGKNSVLEKKTSEYPLLTLLKAINEIEGIKRIRLGSLEPRILTEDFVQALAGMPKICPHFHVSLQSGCDETLRRMNRRYTTREYEESCMLLRRYFSNPAITTDVIVGFPQETEEEFAQTKEFLKRIHFYEMHVFKYSRRQGTRAADMTGQIPESVKSKRSAELIALGKQMSEEYRRSWIGKPSSLLPEEKAEINGRTYAVGFTPEYIRCAISMENMPEECLLMNGKTNVKQKGMFKNRIAVGRITDPLQDEIYGFLEDGM